MARRSDRTTGLPRSRRRREAQAAKPSGRLHLGERAFRIAMLAGSSALLAIVILVMAAGWYHDRWGHGREVVLRVDQETATLSYFADRLYDFVVKNQTSNISPEIGLMAQLEKEALLLELAKESAIDLSDEAVDRQIATELGVPVGGSGSAFDSALRAKLRESKMSLSTFRRQARAGVAEAGLRQLMRDAVGTKGELVTLRVVVVSDEQKAASIVSRINSGENMGAIAQVESIDLVSRAQDGLRDGEPQSLMRSEIAAALEGVQAGTLVGPVGVDGVEYWVVRVEDRSEGEYTEAHREQLARQELGKTIEQRRAAATIRRSADSGDYAWATDKARN